MYTHEEINGIIKESDQFEKDLADLIEVSEDAVMQLGIFLEQEEQYHYHGAVRNVKLALETVLANIGKERKKEGEGNKVELIPNVLHDMEKALNLRRGK